MPFMKKNPFLSILIFYMLVSIYILYIVFYSFASVLVHLEFYSLSCIL